jgi:hypothetical protein
VSSEDLVEIERYFKQVQSLKNLKSEVAETRKRMKDLQALGIDPDSIPDDAQLAKAQPDATAVGPSPSGSQGSGPVELKPTFHDDLPGSR